MEKSPIQFNDIFKAFPSQEDCEEFQKKIDAEKIFVFAEKSNGEGAFQMNGLCPHDMLWLAEQLIKVANQHFGEHDERLRGPEL